MMTTMAASGGSTALAGQWSDYARGIAMVGGLLLSQCSRFIHTLFKSSSIDRHR